MSSKMSLEQAKEYAKTMTYRQAVANVTTGKGVRYRKATMIKLRELAEIADRLDKENRPQGKWDALGGTDFNGISYCAKCSNCKAVYDGIRLSNYSYCPNCGAYMKTAEQGVR